MDRRTVLKSTAALSAMAYLPLTVTMATKKSYKMGLQLFTIRDAMEKDPIGSLKYAKKLGYEDFETYGYDIKNQSYYGYHAMDLKLILDDLGLTTTSGHYAFSDYFGQPKENLLEYTKHCIEGAQMLGKSFVTWPWLDPLYRNMEGIKLLCDKLNRIAQLVTSSGLGFAYHNHGFEFEIKDEHDNPAYEYLLTNTDPEKVKIQMDLYWVMHSSNKKPKDWIAEQKGRVVMWHIKDMDKVTRDYTELGKGSIDYISIMPDPYMSGLQFYYLEQGGNYEINSLESIKTSALHFQKALKHLI